MNSADQSVTADHSEKIDLNIRNNGQVRKASETSAKENMEGSRSSSPEAEGHNEDKQMEDDQESVIIEETGNQIIDLNEDSDEPELLLDKATGDTNNVTELPTTKTTEFVIVNAANVAPLGVTDCSETANRYAIDDIQIKDELTEAVTADINTNDVLENDPMDLLELNTRSECASSIRSQEDTDDYGDDVSSIGSSSAQTGSTFSVSILDWIKDYPWFLYEEGDEPFGYCLYCDIKINKSQRSVKQHGMSLYHKERCENYFAFREEEEKNGLSMDLVEIKEEFGTDSRVEALKLKRKSQSDALNNFNWRRWLQSCPWLERDSAEGTIGYCKYCLIHVNVEFSYLRDRHQEAAKHKEAEKHHEEHHEHRDQNNSSASNEEKDKDSAVDSSQTKNQIWMELLEAEPTMARCKACATKVTKCNFPRHLRTHLHETNANIYLKKLKAVQQKELDEETIKNQKKWKLYAEQHPWMDSDPTDPSFAYCKYCEKRIIYGASAIKRATHENSSQHKQNEEIFKKNLRKANANAEKEPDENDSEKEQERDDSEDQNNKDDGEGEERSDGNEEDNEEGINYKEDNDDENENNDDDDDDEEEEDEDEDEDEEEEAEVDNEEGRSQGEETEEENGSKKRVYKLSDEWLNQYSWCKRYKKDAPNSIYCIYCKIPLSAKYSRAKHQSTSLHISAEKEFLERQAKKQKVPEKKQSSETTPFFEWAIPLRNNPNNYSCRYCRVRISKNYSKKQHESSKIHQINENIFKNKRRKSLRKDENTNTNISEPPKVVAQQANALNSKKIQTFSKVVIKAPSTVSLIKQYQKKFPWLSYKRSELRTHYGHCKICDSSLYIRSLKHILRHLRSGRHISILKSKKVQKTEKDPEVDDKKSSKEERATSPAPVNNYQNQSQLPTTETTSEIVEMRKRFSWIEKSERPNYAFCRFCNSNIPFKIMFLRNHSNSRKHRSSVINYYSNGKKFNRENIESNNASDDISKCGDLDDDVMIVEDNNEEILISEQDENWAVKSETMDEHEELDYLLQRSFNNNQNSSTVQRNVRRSINDHDDPPAKRLKRSQSSRRLNDSNNSLVASLLTTPLTLASCLGPLIQQQIQQVNASQILLAKNNASLTASSDTPRTARASLIECENTYDLFFKSVSETMKKFPVDLAAEGKLRVMQIICDLELQALKRQQSVRSESVSSNTSGGLSHQATSTSTGIHSMCNSSVVNDVSAEQIGTGNETVITQLNTNTDVSTPSDAHIPPKVINTSSVENPATSCAASPLIGVMDKNGLQTLQFRPSVSKQIPRNTSANAITTVANSGIRCIPFKNLSQPAVPDTSNTKITRIQVPLNVPSQTSSPNANAVNNSKNLINYRNIQITKRITAPTTSTSPTTGPQQTSTMANTNSHRNFLTNIQPQLQRWGCSVNGTASQHVPTSSTVSHVQQLPLQRTSTPISKK